MPAHKDNAAAAKELLGGLRYVNEARFRENDQAKLYQKMGKVVKQFLQADVRFPRVDKQHWHLSNLACESGYDFLTLFYL